MPTAITDWHPGEKAVQNIIHLPEKVPFTWVQSSMPDQHRIFYSSRLYFLPATTLDSAGRPWVSVLTAKNGLPGFISSPDESTLVINAGLWKGDPILENLGRVESFEKTKVLMSAVGLETTTRRRNKFAGSVAEAITRDERDLFLRMHVSTALGLCPKYITVRSLAPFPDNSPQILHQDLNMGEEDRLPSAVIEFIHSADSAYLGSYYRAPAGDEDIFPSHVGQCTISAHTNRNWAYGRAQIYVPYFEGTNHRGGRPGFTRVRPSDGRTLVLPNYAGNRTMSSLGNIYITPLAAMVFPGFASGSILYVTGQAKTLFGSDAQDIMPGMKTITLIRATGYSLVTNALPFRETTPPARSPYSPPLRFLAEETPPTITFGDISAQLTHVRIHNASLATLTFRAAQPVIDDIKPSGNVVLDLSAFIRRRSHELLEWAEDGRTNDDCVRTWTVSISPTTEAPNVFSITMRDVPGGLVTPVMYQLASKYAQGRTDHVDITNLDVTILLRGIGGELAVPEAIARCDGGRKLLWIAGGIGITPFLGLTRYVARLAKQTFGLWDIVLVVSTREPDVIVTLISEGLAELQGFTTLEDFKFVFHLFSPTPPSSTAHTLLPAFVELQTHMGRVDKDVFEAVQAKDREPHICGPLPFINACMSGMGAAGVDLESVKRERFTY